MLYNANALLWNDSMYSNEYNIYTKSKLSYIGYHVYLRINIWQHYSIQNICCRCNRFVWLRCILVREWLYILCWNLTIHQYTFSKKLWYEKHCHHFEYIIFFRRNSCRIIAIIAVIKLLWFFSLWCIWLKKWNTQAFFIWWWVLNQNAIQIVVTDGNISLKRT